MDGPFLKGTIEFSLSRHNNLKKIIVDYYVMYQEVIIYEVYPLFNYFNKRLFAYKAII